MATTTSHAMLRRWQQQSHFVSRELIISRWFHIASRDGDSNNKVAAATTFVGSTLPILHVVSLKSNDEWRGNEREIYCIARWRRQQDHGCDNNIAACTIVTTYNIASHGGDDDNASRDGDDSSYRITWWRRRQRVNNISCYLSPRAMAVTMMTMRYKGSNTTAAVNEEVTCYTSSIDATINY